MSEEEISFVRKPSKHGKITLADGSKESTYVFTIPQNYIRSGLINPILKYRVKISKFESIDNKVNQIKNLLESKVQSMRMDQGLYIELMHEIDELLR